MDNYTQSILANDKKQYEKEQDELLKTILELRFFNPWKLKTSYVDMRSLQHDSNLEIYITNTCNQQCSYCYLPQYPDLYPQECNNNKTILNNLRILYDYIIEKGFYIPHVNFFTGEIWHTQLGYGILDITYEYITQRGLQIGDFTIPTNCYFATKDETFQKMQQYVDKFNNCGTPLFISLSIDGKYVDSISRKRNDEALIYTDEFYDAIFTFAKYNDFCFHPIISAEVIDLWPDNLKWWMKQCEKFNIDFIKNVMFLECRNNDWTEEAIKKHCNLIETIADYYLTVNCKNDMRLFADALIGVTHGQTGLGNYHPWVLTQNDTFLGCTVAQYLTVRLGDLAICPCHRQAYEKYLYGRFIVENNKITGIKAINPYMAIKILMANTRTAYHGCASCIFNKCCLKGCLGSQLETLKDPFFPIPSVCMMFKMKYKYLIDYYSRLGLFDYYAQYPVDTAEAKLIAFLLQLKLDVEGEENGK